MKWREARESGGGEDARERVEQEGKYDDKGETSEALHGSGERAEVHGGEGEQSGQDEHGSVEWVRRPERCSCRSRSKTLAVEYLGGTVKVMV